MKILKYEWKKWKRITNLSMMPEIKTLKKRKKSDKRKVYIWTDEKEWKIVMLIELYIVA